MWSLVFSSSLIEFEVIGWMQMSFMSFSRLVEWWVKIGFLFELANGRASYLSDLFFFAHRVQGHRVWTFQDVKSEASSNVTAFFFFTSSRRLSRSLKPWRFVLLMWFRELRCKPLMYVLTLRLSFASNHAVHMFLSERRIICCPDFYTDLFLDVLFCLWTE